MDDIRERGVGEPPEVRRPAGGDEAGQRDEASEIEQPVGERIQSGEGDVGGTDLQRQDDIGESEDVRRRVRQQHDGAVHGEQLIVLLIGQELQPRPGQLGAHECRHAATDDEEDERGDHVQLTDGLMVGGPQVVDESGALALLPRRVGARDHGLGLQSGHVSPA